MKPFAHTAADSPALRDTVLLDLDRVVTFLARLPDAPHRPDFKGSPYAGLSHTHPLTRQPEPLWSCHALVRAIKPGLLLAWEIRDGWFFKRGHNHSWLEYEDPNGHYILDVYPVGALTGPAVYDAHDFIHREMFIAPPYDQHDRRVFDREAELARQMVAKAAAPKHP